MRSRKILVINPNSNEQVTRHLAEALQPLQFQGGAEIECLTLKEGPSLQTNFVDCDLEKLTIGQKVKVVFKPTDSAPLPFFTPA